MEQLWSLDTCGKASFLLAGLLEATCPSKVFILTPMTWIQLSVVCDSMKGLEDQKTEFHILSPATQVRRLCLEALISRMCQCCEMVGGSDRIL